MKSEPVKVLYFVDRMLRGGIQSLVMDWVSRFDKEKIHVDFLLLDDGKKYELEDKLVELGCNVYKLNGIWINKPIDFFKEAKALDNFFKVHHDYKVVHLHSTSKNYMVLKYAKKYGIPIRISHSHNIDFQTKNPIKKIIGNVLKPKLIKYSTDYFACSKIAGEWLFGSEIVNSDKFKVIHNAVDYDRFKYDKDIRNEFRKKLGLSDNDILIGNVGRFTNQKNHSFLIDIFYECCQINQNYKLLLVGTGVLENKIKEKTRLLGIEDNVIFAGFRVDVNNLMQAMDIFLFPSKYEGLGLVLIEAQCSGLPCFTTKNLVPEEVKINKNLEFIELNNNPKEWANQIINCDLSRQDKKKELKEAGYFIDDIIIQLEEFYLNYR